MAKDQAVHLLEPTQVEDAIAMLREESGERPTPAQWRRFRWFELSFWGCLVAATLFLVEVLRAPASEPATTLAVWALVVGALLLCVLVVSLVRCWALARVAWRDYRTMLAVGVWKPLAPSVPRWRRRLAAGALVVLAPFIALVVVSLALFPMTLPLVLTAPFYVFIRKVRRRLALLDSVPDLIGLLEQQRAGSPRGGVRVPGDHFRRIADVEDARVQRLRTAAFASGPPRPSGYALSRSPGLLDETSRLDPERRLLVESRLIDLTTSPELAEKCDGEAGTRRAPVPGTALEILYRIDEPEHRIDVIALGHSGGEPARAGGEAFHA